MKLRPYLPSFLLLLMLLLLAGCGRAQTSQITIKLEGMRFQHDSLQVQTGQSITLQLVNKDGFAHAFDLDDFDIHLQLAAEETVEVTFTPAQSGTFTFYCGSPGHEAAGMVGSITVLP